MKAVLQRVSRSSVTVDGAVVGRIGHGLLILLGVSRTDDVSVADRLAEKIVSLRIFSDPDGKMNCSLADVKGSCLVVSQFTLYGDCDRGRRPSFEAAADPALAQTLYEHFVNRLRAAGIAVETGIFRAKMDVELVNDGPVTFVLEM